MTPSGRVGRAEEVVQQQRATLPRPPAWSKEAPASPPPRMGVDEIGDYMALWWQLAHLQAVVMGEE